MKYVVVYVRGERTFEVERFTSLPAAMEAAKGRYAARRYGRSNFTVVELQGVLPPNEVFDAAADHSRNRLLAALLK